MKDHERNTDGMNGKTIVGSLFFLLVVDQTYKKENTKTYIGYNNI